MASVHSMLTGAQLHATDRLTDFIQLVLSTNYNVCSAVDMNDYLVVALKSATTLQGLYLT